MRVQRQLLRHDERRDEDDGRASVGGEPAGEIQCVLALVATEERNDDAPVANGGGPAREPAGSAPDEACALEEGARRHRRSREGTLARRTPRSKSRRRE